MSAATAELSAVKQSARLSELFVRHYRRVLMAAHRIVGNMADAEDVAQAVFLRVGSTEWPAISNEGSYLYRAAINGALDLLRRRKTALFEPLEQAAGASSTDGSRSPEATVSNRELGQLLRRAIRELSPRAAEMFVLRYVEEMGNREIAQLTKTSAAVVAVSLHQSRSKLKKMLNESLRRTK